MSRRCSDAEILRLLILWALSHVGTFGRFAAEVLGWIALGIYFAGQADLIDLYVSINPRP